MKRRTLTILAFVAASCTWAQKVTTFTTTESKSWIKGGTSLAAKADGTLRFNNEYLAPTLAKNHPEVELWIGTFNTNRLDYVEKILDDKILQANVKGIGTQWECRNNLPAMRERYPKHRFMVSESECGNGSMDWKAGEHTFFLLSSHFVTKGAEMIAYAGRDYSKTPVVAFKDKTGRYVVTAGNFTDKEATLTVKVGKKYLNIKTKAHSFNTYII